MCCVAAAICREHVFHLTFPDNWIAEDICQLFSPYGRFTAHVLLFKSHLVNFSELCKKIKKVQILKTVADLQEQLRLC